MTEPALEQHIIAVIDACVLHSGFLRDFFLRLAAQGIYQPKWTLKIHEEWIRSIIRVRPELQEKLERTRRIMDAKFEDAIIYNFDELLEKIFLKDEDDRHVVAAAIKAKAPYILTANIKHFPDNILHSHGTRAIHPDEFSLLLLQNFPSKFIAGIKEHRLSLKKPPQSVQDFLNSMKKRELFKTVDELGKYIEEL
jgi:predicted nucleic acid-binding protein